MILSIYNFTTYHYYYYPAKGYFYKYCASISQKKPFTTNTKIYTLKQFFLGIKSIYLISIWPYNHY